MQSKKYEIEVGGKKLIAIFSDLSDQANGSVLMKYGETSILATAVMDKKKGSSPFFPLRVDYEERFYAAGRILGSQYIRREGRPSEEAILTSRVIDRTIRPLFDQRIRNEVQVIVTALSIDADNDPDMLAIMGASLALATSDVPWNGPVSAVRIGKTARDAQLVVNPNYPERENTFLDSMICGKDGNINMIEAGADEISEAEYETVLERANSELKRLEEWQKMIVAEIGKSVKRTPEIWTGPEDMGALFQTIILSRIPAAVLCGVAGKTALELLKDEWMDLFREKFPDEGLDPADELFEAAVDKEIHRAALEENRRPDNRPMNQVRELYAQAGGFSEMHHGAGLFYRGGTHVLSVLTLGGPKDSQLLDGMEEEGRRYFMHHYNFPPFSSGETGRVGGMNRRAIGHGALAEKALSYVLPSRDTFPYTIRIVSESLASNGSTSMASVCASSLALMDGGVPIKRPVAGIAMGLMIENGKQEIGNGDELPKYKVLTDIQGPEDHHGDMDFKVAGTSEGITAIQMDVKVSGVPIPILVEALRDARSARLHILKTIEAEIAAPRLELLPSAPKIITIKIPVEKIGAVIGTGGKVIQGITRETGADIDINDDGIVTIIGRNEAALAAAAQVESITHEYKAGERFEGPVVRILDFGAFVKIGPSQDGMVHISELAPFRVANVTDVVQMGDVVPVVVKEVDEKGRVNLSIKQADPQYAERKGVKPSTTSGTSRSVFSSHSGNGRSSYGSRPRPNFTPHPPVAPAPIAAPALEKPRGVFGKFLHRKDKGDDSTPSTPN